MEIFNKTYHTPGTSPGTLVGQEKVGFEDLKIRLMDYTHSELTEDELATVDECQAFLSKDSITWIHLQGKLHANTIKHIGKMFGLHSLALEDVLNTGQRPKLDEYDGLLFVILSMPTRLDSKHVTEQVSLFLGENFVISFFAGEEDPFDALRHRLREKIGRIRQNKADYLLYCIIDLVIDQGYPMLEFLGEVLESLEEQALLPHTEQSTFTGIHNIRRELLMLRRNLWPHREVINALLRNEYTLINESTQMYLRDVYDHTIQIMDLIENYREMATSLIDVYLSSISHRLNEIMRVLTMIATVFIPLTFVVGLYGMNFSHPTSPWAMPELHWYYGYPLVLGMMVMLVIAMILFFKRKNWF